MSIVTDQDNILLLNPNDKIVYLEGFKDIFKEEEIRTKGWIEWFNSFENYFEEPKGPQVLRFPINNKNYQQPKFSNLIENSINLCTRMGLPITIENFKNKGATIYYSNYVVKPEKYFEDLHIYEMREPGYICLYCIHMDSSLKANLVGHIFPVDTNSSLLTFCSSPIEFDFPIKENQCLVLTGDPTYQIQKILGHGRMKLIWVYLYK